MKKIAWIGIFLISAGWFISLDIYTARSGSWFWMVLIGTLLLYPGLKGARGGGAWVLIPGAISAFLFQRPYSACGGFLFVAGVLYLFRKRSLPGRLGNCFLASGFMLFLYAAATGAYYYLSPHLQGHSYLSPLFYAVIKLFAHDAALTNGVIVLPTVNGIREVAVTFEKLGLFPVLLLYLGGLSYLYFTRVSGKAYTFLTLSTIGFVFVRYAALVFIFLESGKSSLFWARIPVVLSVLPLPLFLWLFMPRTGPANANTNADSGGNGAESKWSMAFLLFLMVFVSGVCAAGFSGFGDPGTKKHGRILIDEGHSDWEWTTEAFDTNWYGGRSGYNYYCLREYLNYFYRVDTTREKITPDLMSNYDIFFIKTPTRPFSNDEVDAIEKFVRKGGGLFLDGDHTNVFGTSTFLNPIAGRFGLRYNYDATYDLRTLALSVYKRPTLLPHPVVQNMPAYLFATSCTITAPVFSDKIIIGHGLRTVALDYSKTSYFADASKEQNYDFGLFLQAAGRKVGKGRVIGYTDSTVWSNFFMFIPGKPELILGIMEWLDRENRFAFLNPLFLFVSIAALGLGAAAGRRGRVRNWPVILAAAGLLGFGSGARLFVSANEHSYKPPVARTNFTKVSFESEHSRFTLPVLSLEWDQKLSFHTFFLWTQRLGLVPSLEKSFDDALLKGNIAVVINPSKDFSIDEVDRMTDFVRLGGRMLLLDNPGNRMSTGNELTGPFMMKLDTLSVESSACLDSTKKTVAVLRNAGAVTGGEPLFRLSDGRAVASYTGFGRGKILVFNASSNFANDMMGGSNASPSQSQKELYDLEYSLLRFLLRE